MTHPAGVADAIGRAHAPAGGGVAADRVARAAEVARMAAVNAIRRRRAGEARPPVTTLSSLTYAVDTGQAVQALDRMAGAAERVCGAAVETETRVGRMGATFDAIERRAVRFGDTTEAAVRRIEIATRAHVRAMEDAARTAQAEGVSQDRLRTTLDSLGRAKEQAALRAVQGLAAEQRQAALTAAGYASLAQQSGTALQRSADQTTRFAAAAQEADGGTRRFSQNVGQLGLQVQDFAAQVAGSTSALTAFGQQAPQALGSSARPGPSPARRSPSRPWPRPSC